MAAYDVIIVGGGQAGLSLSYFLKRGGINHLVLERDRSFASWHKRWDCFRMNTANWMNVLPGARRAFAPGRSANDVAPLSEALSYFDDYVAAVDPPLEQGVAVTGVEQDSGNGWIVTTSSGEHESRNVVICTGPSLPKLPTVATELPTETASLHSSQYHRPQQVTTSNVVVVGTGSSGIQICEDLCRSERFRSVYLATSNNSVVPWSILGVPIGAIAHASRVFDLTPQSLLGRRVARTISETYGDPAMAPSPQALKDNYGVVLMGRLAGATVDTIRFADEQVVHSSDLTVVWCTGYAHDYSLVKPRTRETLFNSRGPIHTRGVATGTPGLYFLGLRMQYTIGSHLIYGVGRDAAYLAARISERLKA